jgi:mono/diheme cytochrome c family protein
MKRKREKNIDKKGMSALFLTLIMITIGASSLEGASKTAAKASPQEVGKKIYTTSCASCHGDKGDGNGVVGATLNPKPRNFISDPFKNGSDLENVKKSIKNGLPGTLMSGYGYLSEKDRSEVAKYVLSFRKKH